MEYKAMSNNSDRHWPPRKEVGKFCREKFIQLGLVWPAHNFWPDYRNRPNRLDLIMSQLRAIEQNPESECAQQCLDTLNMAFHPETNARKAAAARRGYLWDEKANQPIVDYGASANLNPEFGNA
jgi:hypothetical protein